MIDSRTPSSGGVLIVDDDDDQRLTIAALFEHAGYHNLIEAADGDSAIALAKAHQPALIVLDLVMPGRPGPDAAPLLRLAAPSATIVVLSSLPRQHLLEAVRRAGAVGYVEKRTLAPRLVRDILLASSLIDAVQASRGFAPRPSASSEARRFVRNRFDGAGEELIATAELLVSELVANAVEHASGAPDVNVMVFDHTIRIEVFDDDDTAPSGRTAAPTDTTGRGMAIVDRLATRWSTEQVGTAKIIWFEVDRSLPPEPSSEVENEGGSHPSRRG